VFFFMLLETDISQISGLDYSWGARLACYENPLQNSSAYSNPSLPATIEVLEAVLQCMCFNQYRGSIVVSSMPSAVLKQ
jgi:hypothetical protein